MPTIALARRPQLPPLRKPPYRVGRSRLPNGLRLVTVETPHLHSAAISLYVRAGSRYETPRTNGLSHFVEHMLFRGSSQFPNSFALNLAIEEIGGTLYAETGRDYSLYQIPLQPAELPRGLEILGDLFSTPSFRDIDLERQIIIEEILEDLDDDGRNVNLDDLSRLAAWDGHPLGYTITGPLRNVRRFKTDEVRAHFQRFYGATNMVLCVAGPFRHTRVEALARAAFARCRAGGPTRPDAAARPHRRPALPRDSQRIGADAGADPVSRGARERSRLPGAARAGARARRRDVDPPALPDLRSEGAGLLGVGQPLLVPRQRAHRDRRRLRARQAAGARRRRRCRSWRASATSRSARRSSTRPSAASAPISRACYDDLDSLCGWFGGTELYARPRSQEQRARELDRVRPEDIRRAARRVIRAERLCVVVVGALDRAVARKVSTIVREFR